VIPKFKNLILFFLKTICFGEASDKKETELNKVLAKNREIKL
jgi:hypothetical protein